MRHGFPYFNPMNAASWPELAIDAKSPLVAAVASRTEAYAVDEHGNLLRRSGAWTWVPIPDGAARALDPIAIWAGHGHVRVVCADGAIVDARRQGG